MMECRHSLTRIVPTIPWQLVHRQLIKGHWLLNCSSWGRKGHTELWWVLPCFDWVVSTPFLRQHVRVCTCHCARLRVPACACASALDLCCCVSYTYFSTVLTGFFSRKVFLQFSHEFSRENFFSRKLLSILFWISLDSSRLFLCTFLSTVPKISDFRRWTA